MTDDGRYHGLVPDFLPRETPVSPEEIEGARTELNKGGFPVRNAGYWRREAIANKLECSRLRGEILTLGVKNSNLTAEAAKWYEKTVSLTDALRDAGREVVRLKADAINAFNQHQIELCASNKDLAAAEASAIDWAARCGQAQAALEREVAENATLQESLKETVEENEHLRSILCRLRFDLPISIAAEIKKALKETKK